MNFKKYKEKIIAVVIFILANIICPIFVSKFENIDFKNAFAIMWKKIFEVIGNILTFSIPVWVIIIIIVILYIILRIYLKIDEAKDEDESWYKNYSSDIYNGLLYEWRYNRIGNQTEIKDVTPVCVECKGNILPKDAGYKTVLYCPNCNKTYKNPDREEYDSARVYFNNKLKKIIEEHNQKVKMDCQK